MKTKHLFLPLLLLLLSCNSSNKFFSSGTVQSSQATEEIKINFVSNLPVCSVQINGKDYTFLIDTGAPTIISEEIFQELGLQKDYTANVADSQNNRQKQKFAMLPNIKIGNLEFQNIGSVVIDLRNGPLKCFGFDGIVGANLMAKSFWRFNYQDSTATVAQKLSAFDVAQYDFSLDFAPKSQKTPVLKGQVADKNLSFTFDTGYSGNIEVQNDYEFYKNIAPKNTFITRQGSSTIGLYGLGENTQTFEMKSDVQIDKVSFAGEIVSSGASTLIGNDFLKDYIFVIDWQANKIYLKKNGVPAPKTLESFGFSYLHIEGKFKVTSLFEEAKVPLKIGDEILKINDIDLTKPDLDPCDVIVNKNSKQREKIDIVVKRDQDTLSFQLNKQRLIR